VAEQNGRKKHADDPQDDRSAAFHDDLRDRDSLDVNARHLGVPCAPFVRVAHKATGVATVQGLESRVEACADPQAHEGLVSVRGERRTRNQVEWVRPQS